MVTGFQVRNHLYNWFMNSTAGWTPAVGENWAWMALGNKVSQTHIKGSFLVSRLFEVREGFVLNLASLGVLQASIHLSATGLWRAEGTNYFCVPSNARVYF